MTSSPLSAAPLVIAGATGYGLWPDNSLEGAVKCLAEPIHGIEIDVQMTADGHVVAHHDYHLGRDATRLDGRWLEDRGPALNTLSLADLARYDVGTLRPGSAYAARYPHRRPADGIGIPTLEALFEALRTADGPRRWFYIEIKTDPRRPDWSPDPAKAVEAVIAATEAAGWTDRTKIIAFDWRVLRLARARDAGIATAHLTIPTRLSDDAGRKTDEDSPWKDGCDPRRHDGSELAAIKAHGGMEWSPYFTDVTPERMAEAEALGLKVGPWGLSAAADIDRLLDLGVYSATVSGPAWGRGRAAIVPEPAL